MIVLHDIHMHFSAQALLEGVNLRVAPGDRMALIGGNGTGKTTLLRIMAGEVEPVAGTVERAVGMRIGYLPQSGLAYRGRTLWEEMLTALPEWLEARKRRWELLDRISSLSPEDPEHDKAMRRYGELETSFQHEDGYAQESRLGSILLGLGFSKDQYSRPVEEFSAGWQMRIGLAKLLAREPDFMLLDEPTDHLDLDAKNWLEGYLGGIEAGFVLVSHDRHLLDRVAESIVEIDNNKLEQYTGNYTDYKAKKAQREEINAGRVEQQKKQIHKLEDFVARNRVRKDRASQAQSRIRQMERIERIESAPRQAEIRFQFQAPSRPPRVLLELADLDKSYSGKWIFQGVNLTVERGERIAVVGPNGSGKSTLLRILVGREAYQAGVRLQGDNVSIGWFSQDPGEGFKHEPSVLDAVLSVDPSLTNERARGLLARFQFRKEDVFKPTATLSGGERVRLALARLLLHRHHLLLLDEPTNHLDIGGRQALLDALRAYTGTLVFVSHDRYFIQGLAGRVVEIRDGNVRSFLGTYEEFLRSGETGGQRSGLISSELSPGRSNAPEDTLHEEVKQDRIRDREERKRRQRQEEKRKRLLVETEQEIERLEVDIAALEQQMNDPAVAKDYSRLGRLHEESAAMRNTLQEKYALWDELAREEDA